MKHKETKQVNKIKNSRETSKGVVKASCSFAAGNVMLLLYRIDICGGPPPARSPVTWPDPWQIRGLADTVGASLVLDIFLQ
jgi:hypothetical protein